MEDSNHNSSVELFRSMESNRFYDQAHRPIIISDNLRTPENMGAVLRLAGNIGAAQTLFVSNNPPDFKTYKIKRTASGAFEKTSWKIIDPAELSALIPKDYLIVALETSADSENIYSCSLPEKMAIIIGNELAGINPQLMAMAHLKVYIPIPGVIFSLNVTHALAIGLFEWQRQMMR